MNPSESCVAQKRLLWLCIAAFFLAFGAFAHAADELETLVSRALAANPRVAAARRQVEATLARQAETLGFLDPALVASVGHAEAARGVPGGNAFPSVSSKTSVVSGGLELPVRPGAYVAAGVSERLLRDAGGGSRDLYQTLLGVQLRIPLARDRGFQTWRHEQQLALAECRAAVSRLLAVAQDTRHDVELALITAHEARAAQRVASEATARFNALLEEARERVAMSVVAEYQLLPARLELELRREEELAAEQAVATSLLRLTELIADGAPVVLDEDAGVLVRLAAAARLDGAYALERILHARGAYLALASECDQEQVRLQQAGEDLRPDLSLNIEATWQGEDVHGPVGTRRILSEQRLGGQVVLVLRRPLTYRQERARQAVRRARLAEIEARRRELELGIVAELETAAVEFDRARRRLEIIERAVAVAGQTLAAEQERFRLGDGLGRYVLDAQKDLTMVVQRQTRVAAALLRARADFAFGTGYTLAADAVPPGAYRHDDEDMRRWNGGALE